MHRVLAEGLTYACRWLFLGTLVYAPWAYGCTEPEAIRGLNILLGGVMALWFLSLVAHGRWPRIPRLLLLTAFCLLVQGWAITLNARSLYDPFFNVFVPLLGTHWGLAGSVEQALSAEWMLRATLLLGSLLFVADLVRDPLWQLRLWQAIGLAGGSIALFGLIEKVTGAPMIFWAPRIDTSTFFATYFYHANAGAFLNLALPPLAGLALRSAAMPHQHGQRTLWITLLLITLAGVAVNTSRAAQFLAVLLGLGTLAWPARRLILAGWASDRRSSLIYLAVGALAAGLVIYGFGIEKSLARWNGAHSRLSANWTPRHLAADAGLKVAASAGWFGYGPSTFRVVFPFFTGYLGKRIPGVWVYQHQDYIQTVIEWGWAGALLWSTIFLGGIGVAIFRYRSFAKQWSSRRRLMMPVCVLALVGVGLHSLVDFPLQIASLQLYCATLLGVCWGSLNWPAEMPAQGGGDTYRRRAREQKPTVEP